MRSDVYNYVLRFTITFFRSIRVRVWSKSSFQFTNMEKFHITFCKLFVKVTKNVPQKFSFNFWPLGGQNSNFCLKRFIISTFFLRKFFYLFFYFNFSDCLFFIFLFSKTFFLIQKFSIFFQNFFQTFTFFSKVFFFSNFFFFFAKFFFFFQTFTFFSKFLFFKFSVF